MFCEPFIIISMVIFFVRSIISIITLDNNSSDVRAFLSATKIPYYLSIFCLIFGFVSYQLTSTEEKTYEVTNIGGIDTANVNGDLINLNSRFNRSFTDHVILKIRPRQYSLGLIWQFSIDGISNVQEKSDRIARIGT